MMRALFIYLVFLFGMGPALAETPVYWLEFYDESFGTMHTIDKQFQQLQNQFDIDPVIKVEFVEAQPVGPNINWAPRQVQILRGKQEDFDRYFSSVTYKKLNDIRLWKVTEIKMLAATELQADGVKFLEKAPMAVLILSTERTDPSETSLSLSITKLNELKGRLSSFAQSVKQVQILPLSFDDTPMDFMPAENAAESLGLIGEIVRQN